MDKRFWQFIKFCIVGVSNTIVGYLLNAAVLFVISPYQMRWDYVIANFVAYLLGVLWVFFWNNRFVFKAEGGQNWWKALLKTYVIYGISCFLLTNVLSYVWIEILYISKFLAPALNLLVTVPFNFILNKMWAFKEEK